MSEYIGSRISLISKSDIKYIGTLHEINSEKHTVALESVSSYGTEGRKGNPAEEIPGSDQVYEYIVFRGSDVKELTIVAPPGAQPKENKPPQVPDDPAILGSARPAPPQQQQPPPPQQQNQFRGPPPGPYQNQQQFGGYPQGLPPGQFQQPPRFQGPGGPHGFPGSPGAVPGYGPPPPGYGPPPPGYGMGYGPPPGQGFMGQPPPGQFPPQQQMPIGPPGQQMNQQGPPQQMQGQQQPPIGSKQGTPQPTPTQAPQPPGPQAPQQQKPAEMSSTPAPPSASASAGPPPPVESKPSTAAATAPAAKQAQQPAVPKPTQKANTSRVAIPLPSPNVLAAKPPQRQAAPQPAPAQPAQPQTVQDATQAATAAVAAAMAKLGPVNRQPTDGMDNLSQQVNQMRMDDGQRGRGRGRGRGGPSERGRGGPRGGRRESAPKQVDVPKEDYDFASANAKFNKEDLVKEAIASGSPIMSPTNGATSDPLAATNGHSHSDATDDVVIPGMPGAQKGYDSKKSFFDDISSDLKDRVAQQSGDTGMVDGRAMRRDERSKNMDTFGQGSVDGGYRGGFRGRGRGRGFPRGGGRGFGGNRGGFEGRGGYEGRPTRGRGRGGLEGATTAV